MAALDGFELSIATGDVVVANGMVDGVAVAGVTLDVATLALGNGDNQITLDGTTISAIAEATALSGDEVKLGEFTEATAAATAVSYEGKGSVAPASA
jgi:hypothetical protein